MIDKFKSEINMNGKKKTKKTYLNALSSSIEISIPLM